LVKRAGGDTLPEEKRARGEKGPQYWGVSGGLAEDDNEVTTVKIDLENER